MFHLVLVMTFSELNLGALLALLASVSYGFAANIVQPLIKDYGAIPTLKISLRYATLFSFIMLLPNFRYCIA